jgi:hypothetical protein
MQTYSVEPRRWQDELVHSASDPSVEFLASDEGGDCDGDGEAGVSALQPQSGVNGGREAWSVQ